MGDIQYEAQPKRATKKHRLTDFRMLFLFLFLFSFGLGGASVKGLLPFNVRVLTQMCVGLVTEALAKTNYK